MPFHIQYFTSHAVMSFQFMNLFHAEFYMSEVGGYGFAHFRCDGDNLIPPNSSFVSHPKEGKGEKATVKQAERHEVTMQCVQFQMSYAMTHSMLCSITV